MLTLAARACAQDPCSTEYLFHSQCSTVLVPQTPGSAESQFRGVPVPRSPSSADSWFHGLLVPQFCCNRQGRPQLVPNRDSCEPGVMRTGSHANRDSCEPGLMGTRIPANKDSSELGLRRTGIPRNRESTNVHTSVGFVAAFMKKPRWKPETKHTGEPILYLEFWHHVSL